MSLVHSPIQSNEINCQSEPGDKRLAYQVNNCLPTLEDSIFLVNLTAESVSGYML
jgi:hypothetical protein